MARPEEPMDIDSDFDNKENNFHHSNVLPCTEKGYEELDVSELNMKLRYSVTPAASPMSKSYTNCIDHRNFDSDDSLNLLNETNLTRSLNSTIMNDNVIKSLKSLPLQLLATDGDNNRSSSVLRQKESMILSTNNITVTVSETNDIDENLSLPSSSSSTIHTPEVTTPTKEIPKNDEGSPIMRGLKSVLNMFRSSQSPIPPADGDNASPKNAILSPTEESFQKKEVKEDARPQTILASTPIAAHRNKETNGSKRNSPYKDSIVFNDDLEKELHWKDETTIIFSQEKIPLHKLFFQQAKSIPKKDVESNIVGQNIEGSNLNSTVECMDISYNDSLLEDKTMTEQSVLNKSEFLGANESDSEFLDCETTFTKNESTNKPEINKPENTDVDSLTADTDLKQQTSNQENINVKNIPVESENESISFVIKKSVLSVCQEDNTSTNIMINSLDARNCEQSNSSVSELPVNKSVILDTPHESHIPLNVTHDTSTQFVSTVSEPKCMDIIKTLEGITPEDNIKTNEMIKDNSIIDVTYELDSLEHTVNISHVKEMVNANDHDLTSIITPITDDNANPSQYTCNLEVITTTDVPKNDLPVDIPLPDDDFEKECIPVEDLTTVSKHFTPDLVDNIRTIKSDETDLVHKTDIRLNSEINSTNDFVGNHDVVEVMPPIYVAMEEHHTVKCEQNAANLSEVIKDIEFFLATNDITSTNNTEQINKIQDTQVVNMKESITNLQILPDLFNQTITISNQDTIENIEPPESLERELSIPTTAIQISTVVEDSLNTENNAMTINVKVKDISLPENLEQTQDISDFHIEQNRIVDTLINSEEVSIIAEENLQDMHRSLDHIQPNLHSQVQKRNEIVDILAKVEVFPIDGDKEKIEPDRSNRNMQINNDSQKEQSIEQNTVPQAICVTTDENTQKISLPCCTELTEHKKSVAEVGQNIFNDAFENQSILVTPLPEFLSQNTVCENFSKSELITIVENKLMLPYYIEHSQSISDSGTGENISVKEHYDHAPPITIEEHTEIVETPENLENVKPLNNETIDQNREITEVIFIDKKVLKTKEDPNSQKVTEVKSHPSHLLSKKHEENNSDLKSIILLQENEVEEQIPHIIKNTAYLNVEQTGDFIKQDVKPESHQAVEKANNRCTDSMINSEITKEDLKAIVKDLPFQTNIQEQHGELVKTGIIDEEVVVSGNNSPYVSVAADLNIISELEPSNNIQEAENSSVTGTNIASSPPITSKGYNFNFDEIGDPFATKTKIRMSPGPGSDEKSIELKIQDKSEKESDTHIKDINTNRRKSQPQRKKPLNIKNKHNTSFDGHVSIPKRTCKNGNVTLPETTKLGTKAEETIKFLPSPDNNKIIMNERDCDDISDLALLGKQLDQTEVVEPALQYLERTEISSENKNEKVKEKVSIEENKSSVESVTTFANPSKNSSSEQSTYYSAGTSSSESVISKNVFNLPEIHDMNFNPFATKSRILQSPPPNLEVDDPFATRSKMRSSPDLSMMVLHKTKVEVLNSTINTENTMFTSINMNTDDKMETEAMEKDSTININNTTCSSDATNEKDNTVREIHTEDEDTIEGPFLEAEYLDNVDKMSDIDGQNIDMMQFNELPAPENEDNGDGELFIDAEAFEFLLNQNKSNMVADSGKESLFLKFDPLFAKRMSSDVVAALSKVGKRQSTPIKVSKSKKANVSPIAGSSKHNVTYETDINNSNVATPEELNITVSKPMMVVSPAVNPVAMPRKSLTPTRSNRRSITFTSPAMAVIDRLLSLSANNSFAEHETTITQVSREQHEADFALTQLRELLAEKEINVYNLRSESKELKDRLSTLESQMKTLEIEGQERLQKINDLNEKLSEKTKINKSMAAVVEEYERTIASLIAETELEKKQHADERTALINERDEQTAHLASMEVAFNDLHSKYEKSKQVILSYKANEDKYKKSLEDYEKNVAKMQSNYELLKQHATSKLNHANDELQKMNKAHEAEVLKMNAMIKRKDLHITSLEETLAHKTKANEKLTAICDELINKVG